jgi:hypothetical protein
MDLTALGGLKKRALHPVPDSAEAAPEVQDQPLQQEPEPLASAPEAQDAPDTAVAAEAEVIAGEPATGEPADGLASVETADEQPAADAAAEPVNTAKIEPAEEEHSGHVTLYLPGDLNQWLGEHHDSTGISYPGIVLNAISWAAAENRLAGIFAPVDSPIPANDIFGRAPAITKPVRGAVDPETRPIRFRKDHMQVIISLARTWTADNRNAFFVGVLTAYREQLQHTTE